MAIPNASEDSSDPPMSRQSDAAFALVKAQIISCRLAPGSRFSEAALSVRFGLARAAARAALTRLAEQGLIVPVARHGYTVAPVTVQSIRDLFEVRLMTEPKAAALATGRIDVRILRQINQPPQDAHTAEAQLDFVAANRAFHHAIAAATGNARLIAILAALADEGERLVHLGLFGPGSQPGDRAAADEGHLALLAAFEAGDAAAAEQAATAHIEHARAMVLARLMDGMGNLPIR